MVRDISKKQLAILAVAIVLVVAVWFLSSRHMEPVIRPTIAAPTPSSTPTLKPRTSEKLPVPYINEAPTGDWSGPWKNACEEASIAMVEYFYEGKKSVTIAEAQAFMTMLFEKQNAMYGSNANADAARMRYLIDTFTAYKSDIVRNPTVAQIKQELDDGHPVISQHYGFDLHNPNIPFLRGGTYYHVMVVIGYDDDAQEFIVNDDGDTKTGAGHRYGYELFMNSLHDYRFSVNRADGPPTVLFTYR